MTAERYGLMAEFETPEQLLEAVRRVRAAGYRRIDAYAPFAVEGLAEALDFREPRLPFIILLCGALSGMAAFLFQYYIAAIEFPLNVGGRPHNSWPTFTLIAFEFTVLGAALAAFAGMLAFNRLPLPYHPVFNAGNFGQASQDRFFLCVEASDPLFETQATRQFLSDLHPLSIEDVAP
ncbi:MAG TPA: DUF3341 domain-containing protein [Methylococcaceae bacterium]|jgi:hypothetical protein|nr:DUF3341 domain-containing protein [Methylococcaceae bacterium]